MTGKQKRKVIAALKLDGNLSGAARRAGVTLGAVRWFMWDERAIDARARGLAHAAQRRDNERAHTATRLGQQLERAQAKLARARSDLARRLPTLSVQGVREAEANIEMRVQEVAGYERELKRCKYK